MKCKVNAKAVLSVLCAFVLAFSLFSLPVQAYAVSNANVNAYSEFVPDVYKNIDDPTLVIGELDYDAEVAFEIELSESTQDSQNRDFHIPNVITIKLVPGKTGFMVSVYNFGIDALSSISMTLRITDYNGNYVTSKTISDVNVPVGDTVYTWLQAKSATIKETVTLNGYAIDGPTYTLGPMSTYRYNFAGGSYGSLSAYEGQRHHIPSNSVTSLTTYSGPAIRMLTEDHKLTASYGSSSSAQAFRAEESRLIAAGKFDAAMQMGIDDIRDLFGSKYDDAISEMISYAVRQGYITSGSVR